MSVPNHLLKENEALKLENQQLKGAVRGANELLLAVISMAGGEVFVPDEIGASLDPRLKFVKSRPSDDPAVPGRYFYVEGVLDIKA